MVQCKFQVNQVVELRRAAGQPDDIIEYPILVLIIGIEGRPDLDMPVYRVKTFPINNKTYEFTVADTTGKYILPVDDEIAALKLLSVLSE